MSLASNELKKRIMKIPEYDYKQNCLAVVNGFDNDGIYLTFYGDTDASKKPYKRIESYIPHEGDTVIVERINNSYVVIGKVV